ncbi:protein-tyrosine phosphatase [Anaeromyces robustus]|uniref:Protein-tyrosine phosphatase n=1 Tax=Anaeromyces robustus TaxID=1754192 RepID=A0A1Y1WPG4_9FUNG|nr:protein-tyrosine phosphatase [Anaeromyces robustus]|eukprot:ORX75372.1 protein-tyrosine phosphatase [Anaeromyces robustus]
MLIPPELFGLVEKDIYRSNTLKPENFPFIKTLNLRTALLLSPEIPTRTVSFFFEESGIKLVHLGIKTWKPDIEWRPVSDELIKEGIEFILNVQNHPTIVICTSGIHETGTLIGCFRKLQRWNFNSILFEYHSFGGSKSRNANEQYIELFDIDLISLPKNLPSWFIDQQQMMNDEEKKMKNKQNKFID